jgi:hypothetical protein
MANAFQDMLEKSGLTTKILAINADNATSNDTQTTKLDQLDNSFDEENRVRCFNHTLQLSVKSLLKPFNTAISEKSTNNNDDDATAQDHDDSQVLPDDSEEEGRDEEEIYIEGDVEDDCVNELQELSEDERVQVLEETAVVRETITKVHHLHTRILYY